MSRIHYFPLTAGIIESGLSLQSNGAQYQGSTTIPSAAMPQGVAGHLEPSVAPDGSPAMLSRITANDVVASGKVRSEVLCDTGLALVGTARERWYVWEIFIPFGWSVGTPIIIFQIHDDPDAGESPVKYINFGLFASSSELICRVPRDTPNEAYSTERVIGTVPIITGRWVKCALHARWETDASGFIEFAYDGRMVANEWFRPSHFPDLRRPYFKAGLYNTSGNQSLIDDHSAWYRDVEIWEGPHTAAEVLGAPIAPAMQRVFSTT